MHLNRHGFQRDEEAWLLPEDAAWVESVVRTAEAGNGIVLHGEPGAGQDEFARSIARRLAARTQPVELACPPDAGTLTFLEEMLASLPAPGRVLFIPELPSFEGPAVELVARLVLRYRAIVVAVAGDPHGALEASLTRLVRLERIRVRHMTLDQGLRFMEYGLDGELSDRAGYALWENGGGNRSMIRLIAEDWCDAGFLVREDDIWVIRGATPPVGPRLASYWQNWLAGQDGHVREVLEVLALARELPLNLVLELCGPEAVDAVHDLGYLDLKESMRRDVSVRGMINVQAIADQVPPGRSRRLLDGVIACVERLGLGRPPGTVAWRLRCGVPVDPEHYLLGVEHLLLSTSPTSALDMLKHLPEGLDPERVDAVRLGALMAAGEFVDLWTRAGNLQLSRAIVRSGETGGSDGSSDSDAPAPVPAAELIFASWKGDYRPILASDESQPLLADGVSWLWRQIRHEAMVLSGRVQDGLHADRDLWRVLEQSGTASFLVQRARMGTFDLECLAGEWTRAISTLAGGWNAELGAPGPGRAGSTYNAIAHALGGEYAASAEMLRREVPQLRVLGRHDVLPLAYAVQAMSLAGLGRRQEALAALAAVELPRNSGLGLWRFEWSATFFTAQALGLLGRVEPAVEMLLDFAARDRELGNYAQELMTLSAAVQWGSEPAIDLLARAAERVDGRFAEACTWVVRGLRNDDSAELEYGALLCRNVGQHLFGDFAQRRLEALHGPCPLGSDDAGAVQREASPDTGPIVTSEALQSLTPRQRDIVRHVMANRSNGEIAESIGLSVRTVESHLYQTYAKLNVSNRAQLRDALVDADSLKGGTASST